jgi:small membrane protein
MTMFQYLAGGFMLLLAATECYLQFAGMARRKIGGIRLVVWLLAAFVIFYPDLTGWIASFLSIGRGADVLLYCTVIAFLLSFFYVIHSLERQREQLTYLVRNLAISSPAHVPEPKQVATTAVQHVDTGHPRISEV